MSTDMKDGSIQSLSEDERLEYAEIGSFYRHDNTIAYQLAAVLLPLSFGAIALAAQYPKMRYALALFSIILYVYWVIFSTRLAWFSEVRKLRARELEAKAGLMHHRLFDNPPPQLVGRIGRKLSIRRLHILFLVILIISWIILILWM